QTDGSRCDGAGAADELHARCRVAFSAAIYRDREGDRSWRFHPEEGVPDGCEARKRARRLNLREWDQRYRSASDAFKEPVPLVVKMAGILPPGEALDLACGAGRNSLYLASLGWRVTAVDGAPSAIELTLARASERGLAVTAHVADLEAGGFAIAPDAYDL